MFQLVLPLLCECECGAPVHPASTQPHLITCTNRQGLNQTLRLEQVRNTARDLQGGWGGGTGGIGEGTGVGNSTSSQHPAAPHHLHPLTETGLTPGFLEGVQHCQGPAGALRIDGGGRQRWGVG
jgi:hypothetical protein